jgi:4a-hydroxytetrahydrobiopterin dehydratase
MASLTKRQATTRLKAVPRWALRGREIRRTFEFDGFPQAIGFVRKVAAGAERANHHPDIDIRWNKVTLALTTHDKGGLTGKDFSMALQCDRALGRSRGARA